ncbi:MAG: tRNA (adenosine(37)-N6)-threonylcarbamoyltransferase complex ATPase subunit type 1 TsaE [Patescibacteria group bacterium]
MSSITSHDITQLADLDLFVEMVAQAIIPGTVLALSGDLGAGKTTFTQHLLKVLGVTSSVTSPTFVLMNRYQSQQDQPIYHLDLYRLQNNQELMQLGLDELFQQPNIVIIEWPELAAEMLPPTTWNLQFKLDENQNRTVTLEKNGAHS